MTASATGTLADVFEPLERADYAFLVGLIESPINFTDDAKLRSGLAALEAEDTEAHRAALNQQIEREIRYLGSGDTAYALRYLTGQEPGVPLQEIIRDVAKALKVDVVLRGTLREQFAVLAQAYATQMFAALSPAEQQQMLEELGVEQEKAAAFIKRSAGVFALPMLLQAFNVIIVEGLIKRIIFGTIARLIGQQLARRLFTFLAGRLPWWVSWIGPAAWTLSLGWTALDLQGPAMRKTIPVVLYLGLCVIRKDGLQTDA